MSETESFGELESIAQAIALADGFQLLILECEALPRGGLQRLLEQVQSRVGELRGVPPSIGIYSPGLFADSIATRRAPMRLGEADAVTVIDGTHVTVGLFGSEIRDESTWHFLFQRLNDRRNAIMRKLAGTLILALAPALSRMFLEEAPDMASIRSGMFHIDATMLPAELERAIAPVTGRTVKQQIPRAAMARDEALELAPHEVDGRLHELLLNLFRTHDLHRFVRYNFPDVALSLPESMAPSDFALAVVDRLGELGRIDRSLFERLARERPQRRDEIGEVAKTWGYALAPPATRGGSLSAPSDLHERLLELTPSEREQVMYLAGFAGDDSSDTVQALRERPPTSARELLARARSEGPEALARLADAIDIVTARE
jgi:hypothetical protein